MVSYLGFHGGLDFMQVAEEIYIWARGAWHKFCRALEWFTTWPGCGIRRVFWKGYWVSLKS